MNAGKQIKNYDILYVQRKYLNKRIAKIKKIQGNIKKERASLLKEINDINKYISDDFKSNYGDTLHILNINKIQEQIMDFKKIVRKIITFDDMPFNFEYREVA